MAECRECLERPGHVLGIGVESRISSSRRGPRALASAMAASAWSFLVDASASFTSARAALGADLALGLDLRLLDARQRFALLGQLLGGDDADDAASLDLLEAARLENGCPGPAPR